MKVMKTKVFNFEFCGLSPELSCIQAICNAHENELYVHYVQPFVNMENQQIPDEFLTIMSAYVRKWAKKKKYNLVMY